MIMGDALAVALLKMRDFSGEDFSKYHPGGALGKKLYLVCGELAAINSKPWVEPQTPVKQVIVNISENRMGATVVSKDGSEVAGIITDGDIRRMLEEHDNIGGLVASQIMNQKPVCIDADQLAVNAAELIIDRKISEIVVLGKDKYTGMIHIHDLNREGIL
jgi:arabinose-5-phosphate isomerase